MPTAEKIDKVTELTEKLNGAKAIYLADFTGLDVESVTALRSQLRQAEVDYEVVKNRLAKLAATAAGMENLNEFLTGPTALALSQDDPVEPAKILQKFIDDGGKLAIKSGLVDGQILSPEEFEQLASLPSRDELIAKVVGTVQGPLSGLAAVLSGLLRNLVGVLAAIEKEQQGGEAEQA